MQRLILGCLSAMAASALTVPLQLQAQPQPAATNAVASAAVAQPAHAEPALRVVDTSNSSEPVVSMVFDETPLSDVIKAFRDATGANIISSGTNLQTAVSIRLDNVPWRKGLASILDPQGLQLMEQPMGSGIYVVNTKTIEIPKITRTFELNHARVDELATLFKATLGTAGIATPFPSANVVIITATEQQLAECEKIIAAVDKASPQVYIEVRFAELSASASKKLGLKWDSLGGDGYGINFDGATLGWNGESKKEKTDSILGVNITKDKSEGKSTSSFVDHVPSITSSDSIEQSADGTVTRTFDSKPYHKMSRTFTGSLSMDAFALTMNAFEQVDGVSIFSNPKIIVANEKEAVVDMTTKEPNLQITTTRSGQSSDQIDIAAQLQVIPGDKGDKDGKGKGLFAGDAFFSYGITLKVTPRISPTGLITMVVEPSISTLTSYYEFSGVSGDTPTPRYPVIEMQKMQTVFTMQSGTTAVIGGLTKTTEGNVDSGIPLLRKIPWVGPRVFGWKSREKEQKEIIIFVTVGLADPIDIPKDIGMPKNAILGRDLLTGALKEPGDRTKEEVLSIEDPKPAKKAKTPRQEPKEPSPDTPAVTVAPAPVAAAKAAAATPVSEREAAQPAAIEPLLQNQ